MRQALNVNEFLRFKGKRFLKYFVFVKIVDFLKKTVEKYFAFCPVGR